MGPVIEAIDAGHTNGKGRCNACRVPWDECKVMIDARRQQTVYGETLRMQRMAESVKRTAVFR